MAESPNIEQLDILYQMKAYVERQIDMITGFRDDVTWKGDAQYEQRCFRCGLWINIGDRVASVRRGTPDMIIVQRYVHEGCIIDA